MSKPVNSSRKDLVDRNGAACGPGREAYSAPQLREYGDLRAITMELQLAGNPDGGVLTSLLTLQVLRTGGLLLG